MRGGRLSNEVEHRPLVTVAVAVGVGILVGLASRSVAAGLTRQATGLRGGCAEIIEAVAERIDASAFNFTFPAVFPRFVQHAIWRSSVIR
jgi:hypothetical protein